MQALAVQMWAFGTWSGQPGLPGVDVGDQLQGALDGGEGGAGVGLGGVLVVQQRGPDADAPQRLAGDGPRQRVPLRAGERVVKPAGVGRTSGCSAAIRSLVRVRPNSVSA
jgi:hypothetical protein